MTGGKIYKPMLKGAFETCLAAEEMQEYAQMKVLSMPERLWKFSLHQFWLTMVLQYLLTDMKNRDKV